jgi:hypothetical protein
MFRNNTFGNKLLSLVNIFASRVRSEINYTSRVHSEINYTSRVRSVKNICFKSASRN